MKIQSDNIFRNTKRFYIFIFIILLLFIILITRLFYLQIIKGDYFLELSEKNKIRTKRIPPLRGFIYDKNGIILAQNAPAFSVYLNREFIEKDKLPKLIEILSKIFKKDKEYFYNILKKYKSYQKFVPVKLFSNISWEELSLIESNSYFLPGITVEFDPIRIYPFGELFSHVVGYVLEADKNDLKKYKNLFPGDYTGKSGLEYVYNKLLIGTPGKKVVEVDARGKEVKVISSNPPANGYNLVLTLDLPFQKKIFELMKNKAGAVAVMNVKTGKILAMVSSPGFDPNIFAKGISPTEWKNLIKNKLHPLTNRVISGLYPPGSTFKIITALAGLMSNAIKKDEIVFCNGTFTFGDSKFRCWKKFGHGKVSMIRAIKESCDVYFYYVGLYTGIDNIYKIGMQFGLGFKTGIDLPGEKSGLLPSRRWKKKFFKQPWYPGETMPVAIGQGYLQATPLQMLRVYAAIANGGKIFKPMLVEKITDNKGKIFEHFSPEIMTKVNIPKKYLNIIRTGLKKVVNEPHGTAYSSRIKNFEYSGKTGTAQVKKMGEKIEKDIKKIPYKYRDHAWFLAYAPSKNPEIAVVVLVEHGGHGGSAAAPIAKKIIKFYFNIKENSNANR